MRFFNIDLHISVIEDIKTILNSLGHSVDSWNISGHNWVFNREPADIEVVNQLTWQRLDQDMCDRFYTSYKNKLADYDAFIACYPPAFALLYEKFNKPIYVVAATRYEYPFSNDRNRWSWFNEKIKSMIDSGQVMPIANNKYDKFYCEYFIDREFHHIPSLCDYTDAKYSGSNDAIVSGRSSIHGFKHISQLGRFTWDYLYTHKAIIHVPYNVSIMSIFEQYTANVPLFLPNIKFGKTLPGYLSEIFFHPNIIDSEAIVKFFDEEILTLADFYDSEWMPFVQYYNSIDELTHKLMTLDLHDISSSMQQFNRVRSEKIKNLWSEYVK